MSLNMERKSSKKGEGRLPLTFPRRQKKKKKEDLGTYFFPQKKCPLIRRAASVSRHCRPAPVEEEEDEDVQSTRFPRRGEGRALRLLWSPKVGFLGFFFFFWRKAGVCRQTNGCN